MCPEKLQDEMEFQELHRIEVAMKVLRNKIKSKNMPIIWLEGSEGSGKQSHACNIAERFDYSHIQVESLIKEESERETRRGRYVRSKIVQQRKIPDRLVIELIKEQMVSVSECNGFLISGFPQNPKQASYFVREICPVDCILYLEGTAVDSLSDRNIGDASALPPRRRSNEDGDARPMRIEKTSDTRVVAGKYDVVLERINANEPAADVFMKIEAAILDRTTNITEAVH